jgi:hypothetical protein
VILHPLHFARWNAPPASRREVNHRGHDALRPAFAEGFGVAARKACGLETECSPALGLGLSRKAIVTAILEVAARV